MAIAAVATLALLAPTAVHAAGINYTYQKLFALGDPPGSSGGDFEIYGVNSAGHCAFVTGLSAGGEGIFFWDGKTNKFLATANNTWTPGGINDKDQVVATLGDSDGNDETVLWDTKTGKSTVLVKAGMPVPGGGAADAVTSRQSARINNAGQVATVVDVDGAQAVVRVEPDGKLTLVARKDTDLGNGKKADTAAGPDINDSGVVVFQDQPPDTTDGAGVYM